MICNVLDVYDRGPQELLSSVCPQVDRISDVFVLIGPRNANERNLSRVCIVIHDPISVYFCCF